jgi:hypothetical protein
MSGLTMGNELYTHDSSRRTSKDEIECFHVKVVSPMVPLFNV